MGNDEASRFRELLAAERRSADLYDGLAEAAHDERREILNQLAAVERRHAEHWAGKLAERGEPAPEPGSRGSRAWVLSWAGAAVLHRSGAAVSRAWRCRHVPGGPRGHVGHGRLRTFTHPGVTQLRGGDRDHRGVLRRSEPWHRGDRSGALRAAVFGVNDGLVSNTSLVRGFADPAPVPR